MQRNARSLLLKSLSSSSPLSLPPRHRSPPIPQILTNLTNPNKSSPQISPFSFLTKPPIHFQNHAHGRCWFSTDPADYNKEVDEINLKFAEAREEIDAAMESKETVYFDEEAECAREAVKGVLDMFDGLLERVPESNRTALQRSMGLKMEQLKAELKQLDD